MSKQAIKRDLTEKTLDEIRPYSNNPRKNDRAVEVLAKSIAANGFNSPIIIDEDGEILAGHTRLKAAKLLGLEKVPCVQITGLTRNQKTAYRIADNKIGELALWDFSKLDEEIAAIDWEGLLADADEMDWSGLAEADKADWQELIKDMDEQILGFTRYEADAMQSDKEIGALLSEFESTSPVREREEEREREAKGELFEEGKDKESHPETDEVIFTARGIYQDFGEDFWKIAGELYARGIKTKTEYK